MHASRKITLWLCPLLLAPTWTPTAMAQAVIAASQPAQGAISVEVAPVPATQPAASSIVVIAPATAPATQTAATTAPTTASATQPAVAASVPASQPATQPAIVAVFRPGSKFTLNFKDASIDSVLDYMSQAAGFVVIKEAAIDGRVTVLSKQPVSPEESVTLLNAVLKTNGYTILQTGRILRVVSRDKAKKSNLPVHFGADPAQIANTEEMITQVIPVGSIDAAKLRTDLTPVISTDADVTANAGSNTIIITDTSSNIRHIVEIIAAVDQHQTAVNDIKVFKLKNASAANAAKLISDIFKPGSSGQNSQGGQGGQGGRSGFFQRLMGGGGPGGGPGGGGGGSDTTGAYVNGTVNVSSDDRTNTVVVSGPTETLKVIEGVVKQIDADPTQTTTTFIYNLKNADATNLQNVLNSFFGMGSGSSGTSNRTSPYASTTSGNGLSSNSGLSSGTSSRSGGSGGFGSSSNLGSSAGSNNSNTNRSSSIGTSISSATASANSDLAGKVFVVADTGTNALLVTAPTKDQQRVTAMIDELDRAVAQVLIKVLIAEVTHSNSSDIGVEWSVLEDRASGKGTSGGSDFGLASAIAAAAAAGGPNGLVVKIAEENLSASLRALANTNKLDVLSRPYILASDNQQASIMVGQSVPFITGSDVTSVGTIINQVQYSNIGVILNVTPHINPDGLVILDIDPQVSSLSGQTVTIQAGVNAPVFNLRSVLTRVGIKDGQTVIIGGLMQDQKTSNVDKIPLLGDIPYLGAFFRHTTESKTKTELLIFLTPHVALQPDVLKGISEQERAATKLVNTAVAPGVFDDHMHGMNIGSSTQPAHTRPSVVIPVGPHSPTGGSPAGQSGAEEPSSGPPAEGPPPPPPGAPE